VTGWQTPTQIYNSPKSFSETSCAVDSTGRLVVVFNPNGISSIASNAGQTSWGAVQIIASSEDAGLLPSLAGNKSGNRLALIYLADTIGRKGMRYTFFNSSTGKWGAPVAVPNSGAATFLAYTAVSSFPLAVDEAGNVTFTATMSSTTRAADSQEARPAPAYVIDGFRYEGGAWSQQQLTSPSGSLPDLETSSGTALSSSGVVLIATPLSDGLHGVNITAFRYTPGIGWDTEIAAHYDTSTEIRCSAAWFEGTEAVVVYSDYSMPGIPLVAALYSNGAWGNGPAPPGNPSGVAYPALATAPSGEAFLAMPDNPAVNVTFLRP
jgi:hypothetical protein